MALLLVHFKLLIIALIMIVMITARQHRVPIIDLGGAEELIGTVREDRTIVNLLPKLSIIAETGPICRFELSSESNSDIPFIVEVNDERNGYGIIRVKDGVHLDCSAKEANLNLVAVRCNDEARSESVRLRVSVKDTNDHVPEFLRPWYAFDVNEGKIYPEIARLQTTDKDCGHPYGQICSYQITNALDGFPFAIDDQGVLSNTQPLNYTQAKSYILTVVAHDCGMRQSKSTLVTINVREACVDGIRGVPDKITYAPGSKRIGIVPNAHLITCAESQSCAIKSVQSVITLKTDHLTNGCDRDDFVPMSINNRCGMDEKTIVLLPTGIDKLTTKHQKVINEKYAFDGRTTSMVVPEETIHDVIPFKFTFTFSMKHDRGSKTDQNTKQSVICESDQSTLNRHHFTVYIRHCKLEMLMRRESGAQAAFRAAEWRWTIPEVCDNRWHSYSILFHSVDMVELYIDGRKFISTNENPEILDDWPLHRTSKTKTRLVIGACWHGKNRAMSQFFSGHISSIYYLPNVIESSHALQCSHECKEKLEFNALEQLVAGEDAIFNTDLSAFTLKANTAEDLSLLLQRVTYTNTKNPPTPGHRIYYINTTVQCVDGKSLILNPSKGFIFVQKEANPTISVSGVSIVDSDQHLVKTGAPMLPDIKITVTRDINGKDVEQTGESMLDWCKVHLKPSRDMDLEYFSSPATLIASLNIDFQHDKQGILLKGKEKVKGYREILSKIHYFNTRADLYAKRIYTVQCAMNDGHVKSNELLVTMNIDAPQSTQNNDAEFVDNEVQFEPAFDQSGSNRLQNLLELDMPRPSALKSHRGLDISQGAIAGGAVAVVVIACVGFLLILLVIGVIKMRDTPLPRRRRNKKNAEGGMEWDDAGLNITVNPLDQVSKSVADFSDDDDDESSDGGESFHDEGMSDEEDVGPEVLPHVDDVERQNRGLEWDDTTLTNVSRTYRV